MSKKNQDLQEKASDPVGGGATGVSKGTEPTGTTAKAPGPSKSQGETASKKLDGEVQDTDMQNNTNPTADASAKNKASVSMKEDMDKMFEGEDLSEQFKEKATTFFEAAVHAKLQEQVTRLEEEYEQKLEEAIATITEEITTTVDEYMDYVVNEWMEENEVAIETSLRTQVTEEFMEGLRALFIEHNMDVPEEKVDVVESLVDEIEELKAKLNEAVDSNIQLTKHINEQTKELVFAEVAEGLADTQADKFKTLAEGVEFTDADTFKRKLEIVKESYFSSKKSAELIVESEIDNAEPLQESKSTVSDPVVKAYVQAISRTIKK